MQVIPTVSLIDHENLACGLTRSLEPNNQQRLDRKQQVFHALNAVTGNQLGHIVVGSSYAGLTLMENSLCCPTARQVYEIGKDGAERALLKYLDEHFEGFSIGTLIIGSGDRAFAEVAAKWRARGTHVLVISQPGSLSSELYAAASQVIVIPTQWQFDFAA
ncbi:MAG: NYN domain-containing protein [Acidobacteria bacterium]|nr:NYN domain-containing protein [Acidobacteriota bacterium]